jgi:peroxiredoxin
MEAEAHDALEEHNTDGSWHFPMPATFVLHRDGVVRARHLDPSCH